MNAVKKPELLSPAGSMESLKAAVNNGADAVYLGGKQFSARQSANNFDLPELESAVDYCHLRGVKVYVTVNTIYKDRELKDLLKFTAKLYEMGVDALILQDLGAAALIRKNFPDFPLHASTQLTTNSPEDVKALEAQGFTKIVLSRELNLKEVKTITEGSSSEIETFIHGALCVSYSGQCIMSSVLGGRSGNRGRCAQTCRMPFSLYREYDKVAEGHLLCLKDLQTVTILPLLIEAGISSFKIEGRMKSADYVAGVTGIYRKYIDLYFNDPENYKVDEKDMKVLLQLFNRGGFTEGYYVNHSGGEMMSPLRPKSWGVQTGFIDSYDKKYGRASIRTKEPLVAGDGIEVWTRKEPHAGSNINKASRPGEVISVMVKGDIAKNDPVYKTHDKALSDMLQATYQKDTRTQPVSGKFIAEIGKPMHLTLWDNKDNSVSVEGDLVQEAQNQPLSGEKIHTQLSKLGGTAFHMANLEIAAEGNVYMGMSQLNSIRREAVAALEKAVIESYKHPSANVKENPRMNNGQYKYDKKLNIHVLNLLQFRGAVENKGLNIIYFEVNDEFQENYKECIRLCRENGSKLYAALPRVYRGSSEHLYKAFIEELKDSAVHGFLVRSMGELELVKNCGKEIAVDFSLNVYNSEDVCLWDSLGADQICISPELNLNEINEMATEKCEMLAYGYLPLMTTHQCPVGAFDGDKTNKMHCKKRNSGETYYLKDRKGESFPVYTDCSQCLATILNSKPLFLLKFFDEVLASPTGSIRLMFTVEDAKEVNRFIEAYSQALDNSGALTPSVGKLITEMSDKGSTKGHYFRGIE